MPVLESKVHSYNIIGQWWAGKLISLLLISSNISHSFKTHKYNCDVFSSNVY